MVAANYKEILDRFDQLKVLVVGDVMIDSYLHGNVDRISPEAPVPVVQVNLKEQKSGGAANVALNILALGAQCHICSVIGDDDNGKALSKLLQSKGVNCEGVLTLKDRPTTVKTRILSNGQQILRVDQEEIHAISSEAELQLLNYIRRSLSEMDVVLIEDYNKGLLTKNLIEQIISLSNEAKVPVVVDPKKDHFLNYKNVQLFKPNRIEIINGLNLASDLSEPDSVKEAIRLLMKEIKADRIMLTLSADGVVISDGNQFHFIPAHQRKIYDVSGAGDTVISTAALCLASGMDDFSIAAISNIAGGLVCERPGVVQVDKDLLQAETARIYFGE